MPIFPAQLPFAHAGVDAFEVYANGNTEPVPTNRRMTSGVQRMPSGGTWVGLPSEKHGATGLRTSLTALTALRKAVAQPSIVL
jgi:hypothetical protein